MVFAVLMLAILLSTAVWAANAPSGRPQTLASADTVPEGLSAPEWSSIRQQYEQQRHAAYPVAGGYQARNPGQQWQTRFDGRGFMVQPAPRSSRREEAHSKKSETRNPNREMDQSLLTSAATESLATGTWQWGLELQSYGFAGQERAVAEPPRVNTAGPRVTYDWDATVQEWFVNDQRGLEHGFTVRERPPHPIFDHPLPLRGGEGRGEGAAPLTFTLAVRGGLRPEVQADGRGVRFVDAQGAAALTYSELTVLDADGRKLPARFESVALERGVHAASTPDNEGTVKRSEARAPQTATDVLRLAIDERGARYPLTIDPIAQQAYVKNSGGGAFGLLVAVSGDTVVVGAPYEDSNATGVNGDESDSSAQYAGAAYVFVRNGRTWTQQAYLKASNTEPGENRGDFFALSVAVSGDTVVVGARDEDSNATGVDGDQSDNSALNSGAAYVFVRNGTTWTQQAYLKASTPGGGDDFGRSVAVSGDTVVVGAFGESSSATGVDGDQSDNSAEYSGAAYVFVRNGTTWTQQAYLKASNTEAGDGFGFSVSVSGDTVVVGSPFEFSNATGVNGDPSDNSATNSGAAYVFVRNGTNWTQQAYLKASNTETWDGFGSSVAVSGNTVVVGATYEDSNARGVNGNQSDNSADTSGAAYVFVRNGTNWSQQAYLKASNADMYDNFGSSVSVSGDSVVVGAFFEASSARGVNGNQTNNSAYESGAAYVFVRNGTAWSQQAYLKASNTGADFGYAVAVSGGTVVVGAYRGGDTGGGAAYLFTGVGLGPRLALAPDASGGYLLGFNGAPEITYRLQRAPSVTGPWSAIATNTAPASGRIEYLESGPPPGAAFYRTAQP